MSQDLDLAQLNIPRPGRIAILLYSLIWMQVEMNTILFSTSLSVLTIGSR
jgi:hypothetical protein